MKAGSILAIIGAIVGLISILLSFLVPQYFGWYRIEVSSGGSILGGIYITGFGTIVTVPPGGPIQIATLVLIGGILLIIGAILCIIGVVIKRKTPISVGGILMIVTPLLLTLDVQIISGDFFLSVLNLLGGPTSASMIWGSYVVGPGILLSWGIWIGSFMAFGAGIIGLLGASSEL